MPSRPLALAAALALAACAAPPKQLEAESLRIVDPDGRGSVEVGVAGDLLTAGGPSIVLRDEAGAPRAWLGLVDVEDHGAEPGLILFGKDGAQEVQVLLVPDADGRPGLLVRRVRFTEDGEEPSVGVFLGPDELELLGTGGGARIPLAPRADAEGR